MLYRIIIITISLIVFVNSCNSVVSSNFGTHKLRQVEMNELTKNGLGDADFVEILDAYVPGNFVHQKAAEADKAGVIFYPLLDVSGKETFERSLKPKTKVIAWSENFKWKCWEDNSCVEQGIHTIKGIVRKPPEKLDISKRLVSNFELDENVIYIETGREPMQWWWHLVFMGIAALVIATVEGLRLKSIRK